MSKSKKSAEKKPPRAPTRDVVSAGFEDAKRTTPMGVDAGDKSKAPPSQES